MYRMNVRNETGSDYTSKERDYILEYKSIDLHSLKREKVLGFAVDNVTRDEAVARILSMIEQKNGPAHILFLDPLKLIKLLSSKKLRHIRDSVDMVLADGAGLGLACARLGFPIKERIPMIAMIMDLVRLAWKEDMTIYLLGDRPEYLEKVFSNLQRSFPGVRIIGRQAGNFTPEREILIKESLRKSSPDLIFVGMGFPNQELWIHENRDQLSNAVVIGVDEAFGILSGKEKHAPDYFQLRGLTWFWQTITKPFLLDRFFAMLIFFLKVYWHSFRNRKNKTKVK